MSLSDDPGGRNLQLYRRNQKEWFGLVFTFILLVCLITIPSSLPGVRADDGEESPLEPALTSPSDKKALINIRDWLQDKSDRIDSGVQTWTDDLDPCRNWTQVICRCEDLQRFAELANYCDDYEPSEQESRVIGLLLSGGPSTDEKWRGPLPKDLGKLDKLRLLKLESNAFTGKIGDTFKNLTKLRHLSLSRNMLRGRIPSYFSDFNRLIRLELDENQFKGKLPAIACSSKSDDARVVVRDNRALCGDVPKCMQTLVPEVTGTYLKHPNASEGQGGECDLTPPKCKQKRGKGGCRIELPEYWTHLSLISLNFTPFIDEDSGIIGYEIQLRLIHLPGQLDSNSAQEGEEGNVRLITINDPPPHNKTDKDVVHYKHNLSQQLLINGADYNVTIFAVNGAGPPLNSSVTNGTVRVDTSGPMPQAVYNTPVVGNSNPNQSVNGEFSCSWNHSFVDLESNISSVVAKMFRVDRNGDSDAEAYTEIANQSVKNSDRNATFSPDFERIQFGKTYIYSVIVTNGANLVSENPSAEFSIMPEPRSSSSFWRTAIFLIIALGIFVLGIISATLVYRSCSSRMSGSNRFDPDQYLKQFLDQMSLPAREELRTNSHRIMEHSEMAFVITDLEGSSAQSQLNEEAFKALTRIHDMLIRDTYEEFCGYEIHTEGDSFQLAFGTVANAIKFCVNAQLKFLDFKWGPDVLNLPSCHARKDGGGKSYTFRGPRVRMGIHWAKKELFARRVHGFTRHQVFEGPAFEIAKEISDAASGGQILMSHDAWIHFDNNFANAGFPTIELLGNCKLTTWPERMPIYNVSQRVGKKLIRSFPYLKEIHCEPSNAGVLIIPSPLPDMYGMLTFVAVRIDKLPEDQNCSILVAMTFELITQHAQFFVGQVYELQESEGSAMIAFQSVLDAVRFSFALQMAMVLNNWPTEVLNVCPPAVPGTNQINLFHGPRVAIAIHSTRNFGISIQAKEDPTDKTQTYAGNGVAFAHQLAVIAHGGQIILTARSWTRVQDILPPHAQTLNLGKHIVGGSHEQPLWLFEVLPEELSMRDFPRLSSKETLEPGYRDSPSIAQPITIVFVRAEKPQLIRKLQEGSITHSMSDEEAHEILATYHTSVSTFSALVRKRLSPYKGYQCKEPETGKFNLAFAKLKDAILWACHIHAELIHLDWPQKLLELDECKSEEKDGRTLHRGLKVKIGMAFGEVRDKRPMNTGRADYVGQIPNLAARAATLAQPGQVLVHATGEGLQSCGISWISPTTGLLKYDTPLKKDDGADEVAVEIHYLGRFFIRGFDELKTLYQVQPASLSIDGRFGPQDVSSMYNNNTIPNRTQLSRLFPRTFLARTPLRQMGDATSSFFSGSAFRSPNHSVSCSHPDSLRAGSPSNTRHPAAVSASSSLNGRSHTSRPSHLQRIQTDATEGIALEEETISEVDTLPSISPLSPFCGDNLQPTAFQNGPDETNYTSLSEQHSSRRTLNHQQSNWQSITNAAPTTKSANSDDYVVSIGNRGSGMVRVPAIVNRQSSDDDTTPAEYGQQVATLYSNVAAGRSTQEFSFYSQKTDSPRTS